LGQEYQSEKALNESPMGQQELGPPI